jgi:hypothetical protein
MRSGRATAIRRRGEYASYGEALEQIPESGDVALVTRGRPRWLLIRCPDGCGEVFPVNLDPRAGKAWRLDRRGDVWSIYPSVWRETGCESHFVVWRGRIWWGRDWDYELPRDHTLEEQIVAVLGRQGVPLGTIDIADALGEEPWIVSVACYRLVDESRIRLSADRPFPMFSPIEK